MASIASPAAPLIAAAPASPTTTGPRLAWFSHGGGNNNKFGAGPRFGAGSRHAEDLFPNKLYEMLDEVEAGGLAAAVSWKSHGRSFAVNDKDLFMREVVPRYFKATKLRSFHRQLHLWGFHRIATGRDAGSWWHRSFVRGRPEDLKFMVRRCVKGKSPPQALVHNVPDFYAASPAVPATPKEAPAKAPASPGTKEDFVDIDDEELRKLFRKEAAAPRRATVGARPEEKALPPLPALPFGQRAVPLLPSAGGHATLGRMHRTGSYDAAAAAASSGLRVNHMVHPSIGVGGFFFQDLLPKDVLTFAGGSLEDLLPLVRSSSIGGCVANQDAGSDAVDEFSAFIDETIQFP